MKSGIYVSELSVSKHSFNKFHFCRGNSSGRKTRLGVILKGSGAYIYLGKRLKVKEGDVVFIPENVYCYSEWHGLPEIEVVYLSCFMHYESYKYEPQILSLDEGVKGDILAAAELLDGKDEVRSLEAYSCFYKILTHVIPALRASEIKYDKALERAIEYITDRFAESFSVAELAKHCLVSESTLYHLFKRELGESPIGFLNSVRINVAIEQLENSSLPISEVSRAVGFNSENHFRRLFKELTGTTPHKYRRGG